ncbi:MAG TPA: alkaline phosphatase family protein [Saprospiraceae bacterium]|nr:alkaline phosphatase family protein [Saprospiraceae bacterium]
MKKIKLRQLAFQCFAILVFIYIIFVYMTHDPIWNKTFPKTTGNTCTVILIDGLSSSVFNEELLQNQLPILDSLKGKSCFVEHGIVSFPTMTGYGFYPFITGRDALQSGILGLRWFDRSRISGNLRNYVGRTNIHMNDDITDSIKNFFQLSAPMYTASINTYMNKGVSHDIKTGWAHTTAKYHDYWLFSALSGIPFVGKYISPDHFEHETHAINIAKRQLEKNPKFQWITLPSPDAINHVYGTTQMYRDILHHIDSLIGDLIDYSHHELGQQERMFVIVSDHGVIDVHRNLDYQDIAKKLNIRMDRGNSVNIFSSDLSQPIEELKELDAFYVINGNLCAYLYFKDPSAEKINNWSQKLSSHTLENFPRGDSLIHIPKLISEYEGVDIVAYQSAENQVSILRRGDEAKVILRDTNALEYVPIQGNPFNYPDSLFNRPMSEEKWLNLTFNTDYPSAIYRIYSLVTNPNAGDLVLTSENGYDLAQDYELFVKNYKGGHGGIRKEIISVPFIINKPNQNDTLIHTLRSEDVGLMIRNYLEQK